MDSKKTSDSTSESTASQEEESNIAATVDYWKRKYNRLDALLSKRELSKAGREAVKVSERLYPVAVDILKDVYIPPRYHDPSLPAPKRISRTAVTQSHVAQDDFGDLEYQEEDFTEAFEGVEIEDEHLVGPEDESGSEESTTGDPEDSDTQGAAESDDDGDDGGDSDEPYRPKRKGEGEGKSTEKGKGKSIAKGKGNAVSSVSSEGNSSDDAELGSMPQLYLTQMRYSGQRPDLVDEDNPMYGYTFSGMGDPGFATQDGRFLTEDGETLGRFVDDGIVTDVTSIKVGQATGEEQRVCYLGID